MAARSLGDSVSARLVPESPFREAEKGCSERPLVVAKAPLSCRFASTNVACLRNAGRTSMNRLGYLALAGTIWLFGINCGGASTGGGAGGDDNTGGSDENGGSGEA